MRTWPGISATLLVAVVCSVACGNVVESGMDGGQTLSLGAADATAPLLQGIGASTITSNSALISWSTDELAISDVEYGTTSAYGQTTPLYGLSLTHGATLTALKAATVYHYRVKSRDGAGNLATSADFTFTTSGTGGGTADTTPPAVAITAPAAAATVSGPVTVKANASDNVGVAGVQFLLDGMNLGAEDTAAPYEAAWDTTQIVNGSHTVSARARDAAGNQTTAAVLVVSVMNACTAQNPVAVSASTEQSPNVAANVLDNNYTTRWSGQGVGATLTFDLGAVKSVCSASIAWYLGNARVASFDVALSTDGVVYSEVFSGSSSGTSTTLESYALPNADARYVRIVGNGSTMSDWNSILEARVLGGGPTGTPIPGPSTPPPSPPPPSGGGTGDHLFPYDFNDQQFFANVTPTGPTPLYCGGTLANRSITDVNNGDAVIGSYCDGGTTTVSHVRLGGDGGINGGVREGYRCTGDGATMNIVDSWLEAKGEGLDHADVIQCYDPNNSPTSVMNISNTTIRAYSDAATAGVFVADYYSLELHVTDVMFWGGPYGLRHHNDGRPGSLYMNNVCFYGTGWNDNSFGYSPFIIDTNLVEWNNVNWCTIENGALVVHGAIPRP